MWILALVQRASQIFLHSILSKSGFVTKNGTDPFLDRDFTNVHRYSPTSHKEINMSKKKKNYGLMNFIIDAVLTVVTSGIWLIWIFVREMRRR